MWLGPYVGSLCLVSYKLKRNGLVCFTNRFLKEVFYCRPTAYMCHWKCNLVFLFLEKYTNLNTYIWRPWLLIRDRHISLHRGRSRSLHGGYYCSLQIHYLIRCDQESQERGGWGERFFDTKTVRQSVAVRSLLFNFYHPLTTLSDLMRWSLNKDYKKHTFFY